MYKEFIHFTKETFPIFRDILDKEPLSPNLFSFKTISLKNSTYKKIKDFIKIVYKIRDSLEYQKFVLGHKVSHTNYSVLMSFDFHIVEDQPKLIEINTNASHFLTSYLMDEFLKSKKDFKPIVPNSLKLLKESFQKEWDLFSTSVSATSSSNFASNITSKSTIKHMAIVDENPLEQKAYFEFLLYKKLFEEMGIKCSIEDVQGLKYEGGQLKTSSGEIIDFVYNRSTDFYFKDSVALNEAYQNASTCISPHPEEYQLLADKKRLLEFSDLPHNVSMELAPLELTPFKEIFLKSYDIESFEADELWAKRKEYFFKPKNLFGGKGAYRGANLARGTFQKIFESKDYLVQEYAPAPALSLADQMGDSSHGRWDLRVYVYNGEIQHLTGRSYIGQTTNFRTLGGGFASIQLI